MTSLMSTWMVALVALGGTDPCSPRPDRCDVCGMDQAGVSAWIEQLETAPCWRDRRAAARALRQVSWQCHPEAAISLVTVLLLDGNEEVRQAAACSLAKMKPSLPEVHMALTRAAQDDPHWATRFWARQGLKAIGRQCQGTCSICGTTSSPPVTLPGRLPLLVPPGKLMVLPPGNELPPPGHSPFTTPTASITKSKTSMMASLGREINRRAR